MKYKYAWQVNYTSKEGRGGALNLLLYRLVWRLYYSYVRKSQGAKCITKAKEVICNTRTIKECN